MAKTNNFMKKIFDLATMVFGALLLGFIALPHLKAQMTSVLGNSTSYTSGFDLLSFSEGANIGISVILLLLTIFASLTIVCGALKFLCDAEIVKGKTLEKCARLSTMFSAFACLALMIALFIDLPLNCKSLSLGSLASGGVYPVYTVLSINTAIALVALVTSVLSSRK